MDIKDSNQGLVLNPRKQKRDFLNPEEILKGVGIQGNMKFADFGCGAGFFTIPAAKMVGEHGKVFAVDVLKNELADVASKARAEGLLNVETVWADLEIPGTTKLPDDSMDMILLSHVFFQSKKPEIIIKEAQRVVKTSGKIVALEWEKVDSPLGPPLAERISKEDLKNIFKDAGLSLESEFTAGSFHYGLVASKGSVDAGSADMEEEIKYE